MPNKTARTSCKARQLGSNTSTRTSIVQKSCALDESHLCQQQFFTFCRQNFTAQNRSNLATHLFQCRAHDLLFIVAQFRSSYQGKCDSHEREASGVASHSARSRLKLSLPRRKLRTLQDDSTTIEHENAGGPTGRSHARSSDSRR